MISIAAESRPTTSCRTTRPDEASGHDASEDKAAGRLASRHRTRARRVASCRIASRRAHLRTAFRLVYDAYVRSGLAEPNSFAVRVTPYHLLPTTEIYVALDRAEVIGTVSLVRDGALGLPMEAIYPEEVAWRRMQGIRLAEVSCLADSHHERGRRLPVVLQLMSFMAQCARRRGVNELVIAVHPRHARFYHRFAAFHVIGDERRYHTVLDNPAVAMSLNLDRAPVEHARLYRTFFGTPFPEQDLKYRPIAEDVRSELRWILERTRDRRPEPRRMLLAGV